MLNGFSTEEIERAAEMAAGTNNTQVLNQLYDLVGRQMIANYDHALTLLHQEREITEKLRDQRIDEIASSLGDITSQLDDLVAGIDKLNDTLDMRLGTIADELERADRKGIFGIRS